MKILNDDKISAMSITDGAVFSSTYAVDNVLDDYPGHPFMANSADATIKANISSGIEAIFVTGLMADVATMTINDTDNSLSYVEALNTAKYSDLKWIAKNNDQMVPPNIDPFTISGFTGTVLPSTVSSNTTLTDQLTGATDTTTLSANLTIERSDKKIFCTSATLPASIISVNTFSAALSIALRDHLMLSEMISKSPIALA